MFQYTTFLTKIPTSVLLKHTHPLLNRKRIEVPEISSKGFCTNFPQSELFVPDETLESGARHPRSKVSAPAFSEPTHSELEQHAPSFTRTNGTELELEPHYGDDPLGAKGTMFLTRHNVAIQRVVSSPSFPCVFRLATLRTRSFE